MKDVRSVSKINKKWMRKISQTTALSSINNQFTFTAKMTSVFIRDSETPGCECGWIWVDTSPEMRTRQEMVPHISKTDLEFNDVWMDERVGGGNNTTNKIISRDSWGKKNHLSWSETRSESRLYLRPYQKFGMPVVWRILTRYFPQTSPCVADYSTASLCIRLSQQAELSPLI